MNDDSRRNPWFVAVLVALIGALGVVAAAVLPGLLDDERTSGSPTTTQAGGPSPSADANGADPADPADETEPADEADTVEDISGNYYLDPGSPRIIVITKVDSRTFDITEREPANWPFTGRVRWNEEVFNGRADFDTSGDSMIVTLEQIGQGRLHATFAFTGPEGRVDEHTLVPAS